jgi:predicted Ser/Thr protein kinase
MKADINDIPQAEIRQWITTAVENQTHLLSSGYQGHTYLYEKGGRRWVVKAPTGRGPAGWIRRWMLQNEHAVYSKLCGIAGVPQCLALIDGRYLVLEFVNGPPIRNAEITDTEQFYREFLERIQALHAAGVAHGDLKKKDNIMVVDGKHPVLVDFGVAVVRKSGWAPINHFRYRLFVRFDYNAWIKHKYNRRIDALSEADRCYYRRTLVESVAGWIKRTYRSFKGMLTGS